jgi:hypothetical protein
MREFAVKSDRKYVSGQSNVLNSSSVLPDDGGPIRYSQSGSLSNEFPATVPSTTSITSSSEK